MPRTPSAREVRALTPRARSAGAIKSERLTRAYSALPSRILTAARTGLLGQFIWGRKDWTP